MEHHEHTVGNPIAITSTVEHEMELALAPASGLNVTAIQEAKEVEETVNNLLSPLELQIAEEKLNNVSPRDIARRLGVSDKVVRIVLARKAVRMYIADVFNSVTAADKEMRMQLMAAMIENKMEEEGVTSGLDLAQLVQMLDSMGRVQEQADTGSQSSIMINILSKLSKNDA